MNRITAAEVTSAILAAPAWARVGITMPDERMRERAASELAHAILVALGEASPAPTADQFALGL
ncbi:MAG: hypothetical protein A4S12_03575 [Proteobacteria bacterium SG_bin5]|nr:MAG: hypothetical protein A4S12_03575 [Proteobacteria bacterium SG_bin5]